MKEGLSYFENKLKKKVKEREKKKKPKMAVSGKSVFRLQKTIKERSR